MVGFEGPDGEVPAGLGVGAVDCQNSEGKEGEGGEVGHCRARWRRRGLEEGRRLLYKYVSTEERYLMDA